MTINTTGPHSQCYSNVRSPSMYSLSTCSHSVLVCLAIFPSLCRVRDLSYIRIYLVFHNPRRIALENLPRGTRSRGTVLLSSRRCLSISARGNRHISRKFSHGPHPSLTSSIPRYGLSSSGRPRLGVTSSVNITHCLSCGIEVQKSPPYRFGSKGTGIQVL